MHSRHGKRLVEGLLKRNNPLKQTRASIYDAFVGLTYPDNVRVVDYRSDTFSKPSHQMRQVMFNAKVGDDVYGEDPTVNELEKKASAMFGKEACMFCASGTMSNLLAIMTHSEQRGCEVIVGDESHILMWEQAGAAQIAGAQLRTVANKPNGTFDINEMISKIRSNQVKFSPRTSLVCVENTHNSCGGRVLPIPWLEQLGEVLKDFKIPLHLDGARLFNSVVYYGRPVKDTVVPCDSINICLSKGLGTPMGSLLLGNEQFIEKARILRKVIGGGMRQVGLMAAAGIYALDHMIDRLREDHADARAIAQAIHDCGSQVISVDMDSVETNILLIHCDTRFVKTDEFCRRLAHLTEEEMRGPNPTAVKILPWSPSIARLVVCCNNDMDDRLATITKMQRVVMEFDKRAQGKDLSSLRT
ncbi:L-allo-threonine aldolase [Nesidiocoris tenuis]|uniref:L-allo-threonine aldolase n=1 Tax=Nesidiocoris tenuis TaxID=355587 RepID=A0ABN7BEM9_9HEMI|nr:L-allo-threonine aldolase [Nesidiocoris tenuis]